MRGLKRWAPVLALGVLLAPQARAFGEPYGGIRLAGGPLWIFPDVASGETLQGQFDLMFHVGFESEDAPGANIALGYVYQSPVTHLFALEPSINWSGGKLILLRIGPRLTLGTRREAFAGGFGPTFGAEIFGGIFQIELGYEYMWDPVGEHHVRVMFAVDPISMFTRFVSWAGGL